MKAVCIDASDPLHGLTKCPLVEGNMYNIDPEHRCSNGCCVFVAEVNDCWGEERFVPISDIDETELVK